MTMDEFKKWIDAQIEILGPQLERLLNAKRAIEEAEGALERNKRMLGEVTTKSLPAPRSVARRPRNQKHNVAERRRIEAEIVRMIRVDQQPMRSGDIIERVYPDSPSYGTEEGKRMRDRVYAALARLRDLKELIRTENGEWTTPLTPGVTEEASDG